MPSPSAAKKTASAPKTRRAKRLLAGVFVLAVAVVVTCIIWTSAAAPKLRVAGHAYKLDVASTESQQELGLGGRKSMAADRGMLFTYTQSGRYCYWMKGMQFPLDIIWLNADKRVIKIEQNLSPKTYPTSYCPDGSDTRYVIELNAGQAGATGLRIGQQLQF